MNKDYFKSRNSGSNRKATGKEVKSMSEMSVHSQRAVNGSVICPTVAIHLPGSSEEWCWRDFSVVSTVGM